MYQKKINRLKYFNRVINLCFLFFLGAFFLGYQEFILQNFDFFIRGENIRLYTLYMVILLVTIFKLRLERKIKKLEKKLRKKARKKSR